MQHKKIDPKKAKCTKLSFESSVNFLRDGSEKDKTLTGFDIEAYTGAIVDRWWGKLAIDVAGIKASQQMPIFKNHYRDEIVGYSTSSSNDQVFKVSGVFSNATEASREVKALAAEGFPWQASIGVRPLTVLEIRENSSMQVNGLTVTGPAEVWLESEVFETSFVPLGADSDTRVVVFSDDEKGAIPPTKNHKGKTMDMETLKKDFPDLVAAIVKEATAGEKEKLEQATIAGATGERDRIKSVRLQLVPGHEKLIEELAFDGKTTGPEAAVKIIAAENLLREQAGETFRQEANPALGQSGTDTGSAKTPEEKLKSQWDASAELRAEFAGDFEVFKAYSTAHPGINVKNQTRVGA